MDKLFIDSNVLFAAVFTGLKGSYPSLIIQLGRLNFFELYISRLVEVEVKRNLSKKKPDNLKLLSEVLDLKSHTFNNYVSMGRGIPSFS